MNYIVIEPASNMRALAREALAGKWKQAVLVTLIFEICVSLPPAILNALFGRDILKELIAGNFFYPQLEDAELLRYTPLSGLYVFLVTGAFTLGVAIFFLSLFRRQQEDISQVFFGFEYFFKALGLSFMIGLFTALWALLFVIPGIIAAYRYRQAFYILADDPGKGVLQCIRESKWMMCGNKWKLFCLDISFIGWAILATLPLVILTEITDDFFLQTPVLSELFAFVAGAAVFWLTAYIETAHVAFYDILTGRLRPAVSQDGYTNGYGGYTNPGDGTGYTGPQN